MRNASRAAGSSSDAEPEPHEEQCYDFDLLPDGVSIDGCWECDTDFHFGWSFWCIDVTLSCEDGDDNSMTIDVTDAVGFC